ncbi:MAG: GAF domain-containing protein [Rhodospirillales bacterium]|nr:GAF domain-containing protein [Rhodospirillales bacterium]
MAFKVRFQVSIAAAVVAIVVALTAAIVSSLYVVSSRVAKDTASQLFGAVAHGLYERIDNQMGWTLTLAKLGASQQGLDEVHGDGLGAPILPFMFTVLAERPSLYSLYYGLEGGDFLQVIAPRDEPLVLSAHGAPAGTRWIVRAVSVEGSARIERWSFLDTSQAVLGSVVEAGPAFDPRRRPWYGAAKESDDAELSPAYVFHSLERLGITASKRFANGVFGVDITLDGLDAFVKEQVVSPGGGMAIFDTSMQALAMSASLAPARWPLAALGEIDQPMIRALVRLKGEGQAPGRGLIVTEQDGVRMMLHLTEWRTGLQQSIGIAVMAPTADFTGQIRTLQIEVMVLALACLAAFLIVGMMFARGMSVSVRALAADALRIRNLDFSGKGPRPSHVIEFNDLGDAFSLMKQAISAKTHALKDAQEKLTRLVDLGIAMSAERDGTRLMEMVLLGAKELTNADGATLYTRGDDDLMHFQMLLNDSLDLTLGGAADNALAMPSVPLFDARGRPNHGNVVSYAVHRQQTVLIDDAYDSLLFDFSGTRAFDDRNGYRSKSFMTVPLKPRGGDFIGALQLINARAPGSGDTVPFPPGLQRFIEALAAQAATALFNRDLLSAQDRLMESMIQLVASAIDAKSPYTGGHCARVPELALMLADEAVRTSEGPLEAFRFDTEEEWREFRIGAWLHDCGKVVTPEHIVDKATKLETIYNRIHEVRMRYEVLLRDADIARLEAVAAGGDPAKAQAACEATKVRLLDDFSFIAECNVGGEHLPPEKVDRLRDIAKTTWLRHIDDRKGLAHAEVRRLADHPPATLPAFETVLADKPWHVIPRDSGLNHAYETLGFKVNVPENLYNQGEVYNLSVTHGTLTEEDRFKINEHVMQTIAMLERIAFPKYLKRVPEYAGTHHEALSGKGYPRRLDAGQLSIPSRIMAIADIFEALTASDRPYKQANTLSEAIKILHSFKAKGHIDPDLFDLFLTSGVYRRYSERFLRPEQIDAVDIEEYVRAA